MKRKNVKNRFGILGLCLVTAISAGGGLASVAIGIVNAESETVQATEFLHTEASVTRDENGLRISSDDSYWATMKTVFTGDAEFNFRFPEDDDITATTGEFIIHIADATDDSNFFNIIYYPAHTKSDGTHYTAPYVQWKNEQRTSTHGGGRWDNKYQQYNAYSNGFNFAPRFKDESVEGNLLLSWDASGVLSVFANSYAKNESIEIASFDGTYDENDTSRNSITQVVQHGFLNQERWGLPILNFENGYTVSISPNKSKGTDVVFSSIRNGDNTYNFKTATELSKDSQMKTFDERFDVLTKADAPAQTSGKIYIGWKDTTSNKLYPVHAVMQKGKYEACLLDYDIVNGASVRIINKSGIRFQTMFDAEQYTTLKEAGHIQSFGTLITYTDTLTTVGKDFTIENYQDEETFAQIKNTRGVFNYTDKTGKTYKAYSIGLVDIVDYTKAYSARGYLVVSYVDGSTKTFYTDYNPVDNSRSIAEVAHRLKTMDAATYEAMTDTQKAIIDDYAAAYN